MGRNVLFLGLDNPDMRFKTNFNFRFKDSSIFDNFIIYGKSKWVQRLVNY